MGRTVDPVAEHARVLERAAADLDRALGTVREALSVLVEAVRVHDQAVADASRALAAAGLVATSESDGGCPESIPPHRRVRVAGRWYEQLTVPVVVNEVIEMVGRLTIRPVAWPAHAPIPETVVSFVRDGRQWVRLADGREVSHERYLELVAEAREAAEAERTADREAA